MPNHDNARRGRGRQKEGTKVLIALRVDAEVLAYFKAKGGGYQTRFNAELRKVAMKGLAERLVALRAKRGA